MTVIELKKLTGGINTSFEALRKPDEFQDIVNMYYNGRGALETRRGYKKFGNELAKPFSSMFFFQRDDTGERLLIAASGTNMYIYNEGTNIWNSIKSGLTEFETDGVTRTKWSFAVYKNIIYMCDGVNNYSTYDGTTYTEYAGTPKFRYVQYMGDRIFGAGVDATPNTLYYTSAAALNANNPANLVVVGGDEWGKINALKELGVFVCVGKDYKIYSVNVATQAVSPIDSRSGIRSHRSMQNVEGSILLFNESGLDTLKQVTAVSGTQALGTKLLGEKIKEYFSRMQPKSYKTNCSLYSQLLDNYYFSFDSSNVGATDLTIVYSSVQSAFTRYVLPSLNEYITYIGSDGNYKYLFAPSIGGQVFEFENGWNDNGLPIEWKCDYRTKFGTDDWKTVSWLQVRGRKTLGYPALLTVSIDGSVVSTCEINDEVLNVDSSPYAVGVSPVGIYALGGGSISGETLDTYEFSIRLPIEQTGQELQVVISGDTDPLVFSLEEMRAEVNKETVSLFDNYV